MEGGFIFIALYPLLIAGMFLVRCVMLPFRLLTWPVRHARRKRARVIEAARQQFILETARERAWLIHQATHPNPLKRKPWEAT